MAVKVKVGCLDIDYSWRAAVINTIRFDSAGAYSRSKTIAEIRLCFYISDMFFPCLFVASTCFVELLRYVVLCVYTNEDVSPNNCLRDFSISLMRLNDQRLFAGRCAPDADALR